ncbi:MAG: helix-turn-helix domain-containing protein [Candidatus Coprovivens sp.]
MSLRKINRILNRNVSTISREIKRNSYKKQLIIRLLPIHQLLLITYIKKEELIVINL